MRIGSQISDLQGASTPRTAGSSPAAQATRAASNAVTDTFLEDMVSVSSLTTRALQTPAVRQDVVDSLQQSYASGQYGLDPSAIAAAMLGEA
jgi:anti-sigma28 factor (negative regulator of flagellin synthesis)